MRRCVVYLCALGCLVAGVLGGQMGFSGCMDHFYGAFVPSQHAGAVEICHDGHFATSYDAKMRCPSWSAFVAVPFKRLTGRLSFFPDSILRALDVEHPSVNDEGWSAVWTRGQLAPTKLLANTQNTKKATFSIANVAPQYGMFNKGSWLKRQTQLDNWLIIHNTPLFVVAGVSFLSRNHPRRLGDGLNVPDHFYMAVCDFEAQESMAFYGSNIEGSARFDPDMKRILYKESTRTKEEMTVLRTVEEVEKLFGVTLFHEDCRKGRLNVQHWDNMDTLDTTVRVGGSTAADAAAASTGKADAKAGNGGQPAHKTCKSRADNSPKSQ